MPPRNLTAAAFGDFVEKNQTRLLADPELSKQLKSLRVSSLGSGKASSEHAFGVLVEDSFATVRLIEEELCSADGSLHEFAVLEVGGGIALVNAWLQSEGIDVTSLEPAMGGHGDYYDIGRRLLDLLSFNRERWISKRADQVESLGREFRLIFSNNVLEHIDNLEVSIEALSRCLAAGGVMRHNCPNYRIPFEPHFGVPLVPFAPQLTRRWLRKVEDDDLWESINFITAGRIERSGKNCKLQVSFDRGHLHNTIQRFKTDPGFIRKHAHLHQVYKVVEPVGLVSLLKLWPAKWATPMQVTLRKPD